ncbi:glycosyltransferase family 8 protein [Rhodoferax sp.]|uniref:glycosyltransferase family 8 protein n=1 Tax=Rhodoferax sp. TaxID=50421 RepID=UPI0026333B21|nr:glycosyltransferase family 8 protein [Rhodoferax sp.]MDD2917356.1 glycosyltransferase family 8 protein [Rhodoferax sp.]
MKSPIPVVYCFDAKYADYAAVSIFSLFLHTNHPLKIYCLVPADALAGMNSINQIKIKFGIDISLIGVRDEYFTNWKITEHFSPAVYLKLLIPDLVKEDKIIYLDSDTLVQGDLSALYQIDVTRNYIAGVEDIYKGENSKIPRAKEDCYINSGVMLMNLDGFRQDAFLAKCRDIYSIFENEITLMDQCIINKYAEMRKIALDPKWNRQVFPNRTKRSDWNNIVSSGNSIVIHFIAETKPWSQWCSPFIAEFWWGYASKLNLQSLKPTGISSVNQLISLAMALDLNENYKEASAVKNQIINSLMAKLSPTAV